MLDHLNNMLLASGILNGVAIVGLLMFRRNHRIAHTILAGYLSFLVIRVAFFLLGKENIYDPHSWLYLPPLEVSMAYGPCIYLYLKTLLSGRFGKKELLHFVPLLCQVSYYGFLLLVLPIEKRADMLTVHLDWIRHIESLLVTISMGSYLFLSWRGFHLYRRWSNNQFSDSDNFRLIWLRAFLGVTSMYFLLWMGFIVGHFFITASFESQFYLFAAQSLLLCFLSFESWRHSSEKYPIYAALQHQIFSTDWFSADFSTDANEAKAATKNSIKDEPKWQAQAQDWLAQIEHNKWWQEQQISLSTVAKRLGTNTSFLSRAINTGKNQNFNTMINRLRIEYVCARLSEEKLQKDILELAFEAGFNSKNSFNRNFKQFVGRTPSEYRFSASTK